MLSRDLVMLLLHYHPSNSFYMVVCNLMDLQRKTCTLLIPVCVPKQVVLSLGYLIMLQIMCRSARLMLLVMCHLLDVFLLLYPFATLHYVSHICPFYLSSSHARFVLVYGGEPVLADDKWDPHVYLLNTGNKVSQ